MKRLMIMLLAAFPLWANAAANDLFMNQRDSTNTNTLTRQITHPSGSADGVFGYIGSSQLPGFLTVGPGLTLASGVLDAAPGSPVAWTSITSTPTSCSGYGILDCVTPTSLSSTLAGYATTGALTSGLAVKFNSPTGSTAQYIRGDGSLAALPSGSAGTVTSVIAGTGLSGGTITTSGTISLPNAGTAGSYANVTTDAQGRVTAGTNRNQAAATRALNTAFQVSATRDSWVSYSVQITVTASISGGQNGDVILEIASDSGFTANVQALAISGVGQTYTLAIALQGVQPQTVTLPGYVPAGYYARLRTLNNNGTPTYLYRTGQEVLQ